MAEKKPDFVREVESLRKRVQTLREQLEKERDPQRREKLLECLAEASVLRADIEAAEEDAATQGTDKEKEKNRLTPA